MAVVGPLQRVLDGYRMPRAKWFEGARLNMIEQAFRYHEDEPERPAIISRSEIRPRQKLPWGDMKKQVASFAHGLRRMGVEPGDRVVACLPNIPETPCGVLRLCQHRGDLVQLFAGHGRPQRDRPLPPD